jgi:hypothetical protein
MYWPELGDKYDKLLVVQGRITTDPGPYTVKLSHSTTLLYPKYFPLSDFEVIIQDNLGNSETLTETEEGVYRTDTSGIQGVAGRYYKITLNDPEGKSYTSDFELLQQPIHIDTLYANLEYGNNVNHSFDVLGYQFYIGTETASNDTNYLRWQMEETYMFTADFKIYFYYDGQLHDFPEPDSLETCWKTEPVWEIFTGTTVGLNQPAISDFPLHYVSFATREFSIRYSLLIHQLTLTEKAYQYWKEIEDQNTAGTSLYTSVPYQIKSNVYNIADEQEPVLGYFEVAGIHTKRIFMDRPPPPIQMYYPICQLTEADYKEYGFMFRTNDWRNYPKYVVVDKNYIRAVPPKSCCDCRANDGTLNKPDFWID